jgi:hypothetical protein
MKRDPQQLLAQVVGAVLTLGVAGFLTGGTLLIFGINTCITSCTCCQAFSVSGRFLRRRPGARYYNRGFGIVYLLVTVLGFAAPARAASLLAINPADNFLHLGRLRRLDRPRTQGRKSALPATAPGTSTPAEGRGLSARRIVRAAPPASSP